MEVTKEEEDTGIQEPEYPTLKSGNTEELPVCRATRPEKSKRGRSSRKKAQENNKTKMINHLIYLIIDKRILVAN